MAGGAGVRFWPLSTESLPKQFITAFTETSLYQGTIERARNLADPEQILVMTNESLLPYVRSQSPEIPLENVILEPCRRDTAPAIALAASLAERRWPGSVMAIMPSDHLIRDVEGFTATMRLAVEQAVKGGLGTVGIHPTYPATGFGYLHCATAQGRVRQVRRFVEKPDRAKAETFLHSGDYLWNAGVFVWQSAIFLTELEKYQPSIFNATQRIAGAWRTPEFDTVLKDRFTHVSPISVDFGVMEKASEVWTVTSSFDWNDIGGWTAAMELVERDDDDNRTKGSIFLDQCRNNFVLSTDRFHPVLCVGVQDCIVVHTPHGTLVCHRDMADGLKPMVEKLLRDTPRPQTALAVG